MRLLRLQLVLLSAVAAATLAPVAIAQDKPDKPDKPLKDKSNKPFNPDKPDKQDKKAMRAAAAAAGNGTAIPATPRPPAMSPEDRELERIHELLKCSDDEWIAIRPMVAKVNALQNQLRASRDRGFKPPREGQPAKPPKTKPDELFSQSQSTQQPPVIQSSRDLRDAMMSADTPLAELKQRIMATRQARAKAHMDLMQAQEELRGVTSVHQEATLVLLGLLDY